MTPDELIGRVREVLGDDTGCAVAYGVLTVDVPRERWVQAARLVRDDEALDARFFDVLTAVDEGELGFVVVLRLWSVTHRHGVVLRTRCPREDARVLSLAAVFAGAAWHERGVAEMFGVAFDGHPAPGPLLLPADVAGHPLRKDFALVDREAKPWPGAVEPGESTPNPRRVPLGATPPPRGGRR